MTPLQNLHYALGKIAYAIARSDGEIQRQEATKFIKMISDELNDKNYDFDVSEIIFNMMAREKTDVQTAYEHAMKEIRINSYYLSPTLKEKFINVIDSIATAYPPVTTEEIKMIDRFKKDIAPIHGDPVYYDQPVINKRKNIN